MKPFQDTISNWRWKWKTHASHSFAESVHSEEYPHCRRGGRYTPNGWQLNRGGTRMMPRDFSVNSTTNSFVHAGSLSIQVFTPSTGHVSKRSTMGSRRVKLNDMS